MGGEERIVGLPCISSSRKTENRSDLQSEQVLSCVAVKRRQRWKVSIKSRFNLFRAAIKKADSSPLFDLDLVSRSWRTPCLLILQKYPANRLLANTVSCFVLLPRFIIADARGQLRHHEPSHWVNSPNQYKRVEEEGHSANSPQNGDVSPRVRTKVKLIE